VNKTYYDILQIKPTAAPEAITASYRKLARQYHPDRNDSPDATRLMQEINEAYDVLNDPQKREAYERFLKEGVPMSGAQLSRVIYMHVLRGRSIGEIGWSKQRNFTIPAGKHTVYVKMDGARSKAVQFSCELGERIGIVCGANSALGSVMASMFTPDNVYFIKVMKL